MKRFGIAGLLVGIVAGVALWWLVVRPTPPPASQSSVAVSERSPTPAAVPASPPAASPATPAPHSEASQPPPDQPPESPPEPAVDPAALAEAESRIAEYARAQKLINPGLLVQKAERAVPKGSVPPDQLDSTRQKWMQDALVNAAIAKNLTDRKVGPDATTAERNRVMGLAMTLMSIPSERERQILRMADQLPD